MKNKKLDQEQDGYKKISYSSSLKLSVKGKDIAKYVTREGLEPSTRRLRVACSAKLS